MKELPPKKELILRVELTSKQKEYYKAILTKNYEVLARRNGGQVIACFDFYLADYLPLPDLQFFIVLLQISLINVVMELRKLCCHGFMTDEPDTEPANPEEGLRCTSFFFITVFYCLWADY
jgi:chromodomain-helicase-DNA-binding protein 4